MIFNKKHLRKFNAGKTILLVLGICAYISLGCTADIPFDDSQVKMVITKTTTVVKDNADGDKTQKSISYYDSKERLIKNVEFLRKSDIPSGGYILEYDEEGRIQKKFQLSLDQAKISSSFIYKHSADSAIIIEQEKTNGYSLREIEYYDKNKNVLLRKRMFADTLEDYTWFKYDSGNHEIEDLYYRAPGKLIRHGVCEYDKNGDLIKMYVRYDSYDDSVYEYIYTKYDSKKRWIEGKVIIDGEHFWDLKRTIEYR